MTVPTLHIIGAPESGTGTLVNCLAAHSDIFFPEKRELNYFATDLPGPKISAETYAGLYATTNSAIRGDISSWHLYSATAVDRILSAAPAARFIVCLRNPAEIAWTLHARALRAGTELVADFAAAWARDRRHPADRPATDTAPPAPQYRSIAALGSQLARLHSKAPPGSIHAVFHDDLVKTPAVALETVADFLDLDDAAPIAAARAGCAARHMTLRGPATAPLQHLLGRLAYPCRLLGRRLGIPTAPVCPANALLPYSRQLADIPGNIRRLLSDDLADEIATVSALTGRDLSAWLR